MVTTILNCYKRPQYLLEQIINIRKQTVESDIWVDYTLVDGVSKVRVPSDVAVTYRNHNLYHIGRFFYALNAQTEYVFICDDDQMPGRRYLQKCIEIVEQNDCIVTAYGLKFGDIPGYNPVAKHGWMFPNQNIETVDMAGQSWFMKKSTLKYIAYEEPYSWVNGEDLHLSYMAKKYGNIPCVVAPHRVDNPEEWSNNPLYRYRGDDSVATWKTSNHKSIRDEAVNYYERNTI
jgi:GT2 family glycosyltransferase